MHVHFAHLRLLISCSEKIGKNIFSNLYLYVILIPLTMTDIKVRVGQLIRETRKSKGLTQKELGERIGVAEATLSRFENGNQNLTLETLQRLSVALSVNLTVKFD